MHPIRLAAAGAAALLLAASASRAQRPGAEPQASRFVFGVDGIVMNPRGSFGRNVDNTGFGVGGHALVRLDRQGILAVRVDAAATQYGSEHKRLPYSAFFGGRVDLDVVTRNSLAWVGIGPELSYPVGRVRPYVNGSIAYAAFSTSSDLRGDGYDAYGEFESNRTIASSQNQSDGTSARAAGAGVYIAVGPPRWLASAHLGLRYYDGAEADYLREGSIADNEDGTISFSPLRSRTPFVAYQVGLAVAIPRSMRR